MERFTMGRVTSTSIAVLLHTWSPVARCRRCWSPWSQNAPAEVELLPYATSAPSTVGCLSRGEDIGESTDEGWRGQEGYLRACAAGRPGARSSGGAILLHRKLRRLGLRNPRWVRKGGEHERTAAGDASRVTTGPRLHMPA
jgi:hypothetical protein